MNLFYISSVSSFSIAGAVIIGLIRLPKILQTYQPFIIICIVALCSELVSFFFIEYYGASNAISSNIYVLVEACLFVWQFRKWGALKNNTHARVLYGCLLCVWIVDNIAWHDPYDFNSLFRIFYSFCLIFFAIARINQLLIEGKRSLVKNSQFLISTGVLIFYSYKATIEVFYLVNLKFSNAFYSNIYYILIVVNFIVNFIYALAILWIPTRPKFISVR